MYSSDLEVFAQALEWLKQGQSAVLVTVVKTWGATPRTVGAILAVRGDGSMVGFVSSGCVEEDLAKQVQANAFTHPTVLKYGITSAQNQQIGLSCGGQIELLIEPLTQLEQIQPAVAALERRQLIQRQVDLNSGQVDWADGATATTDFFYDGCQFRCRYGPIWRLLIIGAGQIARYVAEFAQALNYQVIICDPRQEYAIHWAVKETQLDHRMPDDAVKALVQDERSAVITLTHNPNLDDLALWEALPSPAFYVGALGSKATNDGRRQRLLELGITETTLQRLHAPIGFPIGSRSPPEIAIAILAELTAVRNHVHYRNFISGRTESSLRE